MLTLIVLMEVNMSHAGMKYQTDQFTQAFSQFLIQERYPVSLSKQLPTVYFPLASYCNKVHQNRPIVIGVNGTQGSGKSTLCHVLTWMLKEAFDKTAVVISIDDLYLKKSERQELATSVHPLLETRGVPGTHDIQLGIQLIEQLKNKSLPDDFHIEIPVFDKAVDDRADKSEWQVLDKQPDIIFLEGWCVNSQAVDSIELDTPINELEEQEDEHAVWRSWVNRQLRSKYQHLYRLIDINIMLKAPSFEQVVDWRLKQEVRLREIKGANAGMSDQEITRFVQFFQRITEDNLAKLPQKSDVLLELNEQQKVTHIQLPKHSNQNFIHWLMFSDLDGTFLNHHTYSYQEALPAYRMLEKHRIPVIFNTSKTYAEVSAFTKELDNNHPFVIENGSVVVLPKGFKLPHNMENELTIEQQDEYKLVNLGVKYRDIVSQVYKLKKRFDLSFTGFHDMPPEQVAEITDLPLEKAIKAKQRFASEPLIWQDSDEKLDLFINELQNIGLSVLKGGRFYHVLGQVNKATAVNWLMKVYSQNNPYVWWNSVSAGDSPNDLAMLTATDIAICIRDAKDNHLSLTSPNLQINPMLQGDSGWNEGVEQAMNIILS